MQEGSTERDPKPSVIRGGCYLMAVAIHKYVVHVAVTRYEYNEYRILYIV